jgi:hypothetical protein
MVVAELITSLWNENPESSQVMFGNGLLKQIIPGTAANISFCSTNIDKCRAIIVPHKGYLAVIGKWNSDHFLAEQINSSNFETLRSDKLDSSLHDTLLAG